MKIEHYITCIENVFISDGTTLTFKKNKSYAIIYNKTYGEYAVFGEDKKNYIYREYNEYKRFRKPIYKNLILEKSLIR